MQDYINKLKETIARHEEGLIADDELVNNIICDSVEASNQLMNEELGEDC
jgi:hypothetical protein